MGFEYPTKVLGHAVYDRGQHNWGAYWGPNCRIRPRTATDKDDSKVVTSYAAYQVDDDQKSLADYGPTKVDVKAFRYDEHFDDDQRCSGFYERDIDDCGT